MPTKLDGPRTGAPHRNRREDEPVRLGRRCGENLGLFVDVHRPWRHAKVTDRRTCRDFAECMRDLTDVHYPNAERIRVVLDNLSTHSAATPHEAFDAVEARRIPRRLEVLLQAEACELAQHGRDGHR